MKNGGKSNMANVMDMIQKKRVAPQVEAEKLAQQRREIDEQLQKMTDAQEQQDKPEFEQMAQTKEQMYGIGEDLRSVEEPKETILDISITFVNNVEKVYSFPVTNQEMVNTTYDDICKIVNVGGVLRFGNNAVNTKNMLYVTARIRA